MKSFFARKSNTICRTTWPVRVFLCVFLIFAALIAGGWSSKYVAASMRILKLEGTVYLQQNGKNRTVQENIRLQSEDALQTGEESLVAIGLDETKIVTLEENGLVEVQKRMKKLKLNLKEGCLFFQVTKALEDDESFDITTSTMVVGIRGTSGYVFVGENGQESLVVTDGHVHVIGTNPVTGEVKEIDVHAGQRITVYLFNEKEEDSILFLLEDLYATDLRQDILKLILSDDELLRKIEADTGWDLDNTDTATSSPATSPSPIFAAEQSLYPADGDWVIDTPVQLIAQSASKLYDGEPLERFTDVLADGLPAQFTADFTVEGRQTDVGTSPNRITDFVFYNEAGEEVTSHFTQVSTVDGKLIVNTAPLVITTGSAEKIYDGHPLTCDEAEIISYIRQGSNTGQQNLGFVAEDNAGSTGLYILNGTIRIFGCNPITGETEELSVEAGQRMQIILYNNNGKRSIQLTAEPVNEELLPETLLRAFATDDDLLSTVCAETGWNSEIIRNLIRNLPEDSYAPEDAENRFIENSANVMISIDSAVTDYDGIALSREEASIANIRIPESILVKAVGSQTEVGTSPNGYELMWGNEKPENYLISEQLGTLTVTRCDHTYGYEQYTAATCISEGRYEYTCAHCGEQNVRILPVDPSNHAFGTSVIGAQAATCIQGGYSGDTICNGCGAVLSSGSATPVNPGNHTGGTYQSGYVDATCAAPGYSGDTYCAGCGALLSAGNTTPVDPSNHTGGTYQAGETAATCAFPGYSGDTCCSGCGAVLGSGTSTPIDPSNHVGGTRQASSRAATCVSMGYTGDTVCSSCGAVLSGGYFTPALGHSWVETMPSDGGDIYYRCTRCGVTTYDPY